MQKDNRLFSVIYGTILLFLIPLFLTIGQLLEYIKVKLLDYGNIIYHSVLKSSGHEKDYQSKEETVLKSSGHEKDYQSKEETVLKSSGHEKDYQSKEETVLKSSGHEKDYQSKHYDRWISQPGSICRKICSGIRSFSAYPCHELHGHLNDELARASTFAGVCQVLFNRGLRTLLLAQDGFYYTDENIVCYCCGMRFCLSDLKDGDRITHASGCIADRGRIFIISHSQPPSEPDPVNISVKLKRPTTNLVLASPGHELLSARIATFDNQPWATTELAEMWAGNALFYTGVNDQVRCFACGMHIFASCLKDSTFSVRQVHATSCPFANRTV